MFEHMTTADIQAAKEKTERVVDHLLYPLALHENNAIIVYSNTLSSQIRYLHAANAFNVFRAGLHQFEIVRLCALTLTKRAAFLWRPLCPASLGGANCSDPITHQGNLGQGKAVNGWSGSSQSARKNTATVSAEPIMNSAVSSLS